MTILALLGLRDSYVHDGRVLIENLEGDAVPHRLRGDSHTVRDLVATAALVSNSPNDATYTVLESKIAGWVVRRDEIATSIRTLLDGATFKDQHFDDHQARQTDHPGPVAADRSEPLRRRYGA